MHCWKIINVDRDYGSTRIMILSALLGIILYCFSYILLSFGRTTPFTDKGIELFLIGLIFIYPVHKFIHYIFIADFSSYIKLKIKYRFKFIPLVHLKINKMVPKYRYLISLISPFILINGSLVFAAIYFPSYTHYFSIYIGIHSMMCLIDLLNVKHIIRAPHKSYIEETPKGYEVLVPLQ